MEIYFITGNPKKAEYLKKYLGLEIKHQKVDLDEIQSMDLKKIVEHKVRQAYEKIKKPVLVEDVGLFFDDLNGLPGPFIKFFVENLDFQKICNMVFENRGAKVKTVFGYYDGKKLTLLESTLRGEISDEPRGENGFGWDKIFIPEGYDRTRAELDEKENEKTYKEMKGLKKLKEFLIKEKDKKLVIDKLRD